MSIQLLLNLFNNIEKLNEIDIHLVKEAFVFRKSKRNEILISNSQPCNKLFFVLKGMLRAYFIDENGLEKTRLISVENQFCCNWKSFANLSENNEFIQSVDASEYLYVTHNDLFKIINESTNLQKVYTKNLENINDYNARRIHFLTGLNCRTRLEIFSSAYPYLVKRLSNRLLASFLHISPEYCSALKKNLRKNLSVDI